jgi:TolA-binding protein
MKRVILSIFLVSLLGTAPAFAQNAGVGKRVERLEKEMRAVQRKVFPGGSSNFFEPDIKPDEKSGKISANTTSAVTDLIARVDALERSLASVTGQVEQNGFRLKKLEDKVAAMGDSSTLPSSAASSKPAAGAVTTTKVAAGSATKAPDPTRVDGVTSIVMPDTGNSAEDSYIYGYRLWEAKYYPEAQTQLKKAFEKYPKHRRASFAQNLLGRAYLDDGKPALASVALYENYQKRPRGERAPDSLYFLSTALVQLKKKDDACRVLAELQDVYPNVAAGRLNNRVARGKKAANCK